ncbi:MAG: glutathione-disulfide reductase [Pseudomonadota bacterium]
MTDYDFDLFVIGGGSGGVRAARIASQHGAKVGLAEESRMGGTCVIRGCVPKKLFVYASQSGDHIEDAAGYGWSVGAPTFDWSVLKSNKDREIARLEEIYRSNLQKSGVTIFDDRAEFADPHTLQLVSSGKRITAQRILIATGGRPSTITDLPGFELTMTSDDIFEMETFPERVVLAGGGYISIEFAGIFAGLGAETTIIYRGPKLLRGFDDDVRDMLHREYERRGITIVTDDVFTSIERGDDGALVGHTTSGRDLHADAIVMAVGRDPHTKGLGLERAGVATGRGGKVLVNDASATNQPHIFAVGDVTDRVQLTPVAIREGHSFADRVYGPRTWHADYRNIATAVFSQPEIGTVGLTEEEARIQVNEGGEAVDVFKSEFRPMHHVLPGRQERMLIKLLVGADTDKIIGAHIMGHGAGELAQLLGVIMKMDGTKAAIDQTMPVHPTAAEEIVTMRSPAYRIERAS